MKKLRLILMLAVLTLVLMIPIGVHAYDFKDEEFQYTILSTVDLTAEISGINMEKTTYNIPKSVNYKNKTLIVTSIGDNAFANNKSLEFITIPNNITKLGNSIFLDCSNLKEVTIASKSPLTVLEAYTFKNCTKLSKIIFEDKKNSKLEKFGSSCFSGCESLHEIEFPPRIETLGSYCFSNTGFIEITIPASILYLESGTFSECKSLTSVNLNNVTSLAQKCFYNCPELSNINLDRVKSIGSYCFEDCIKLKSINLSNDLYSLNYMCFKNCPITDLILPNSPLTTIPSYAFTSGRGSITIPQNVTKIEYLALDGFDKIIIKESNTPLDFTCYYFRHIKYEHNGYWGYFDHTQKYIPFNHSMFNSIEINRPITYTLEYRDKLTDYPAVSENNYDRTTTNSGFGNSKSNYAPFYNQSDLINVKICGNATSVLALLGTESGSLKHFSKINSLTFGEAVSSLPDLNENASLKKLVILSKQPPICPQFSTAQYTDLNVFVPKGSLILYQQTDGWRNFWNLQEFDEFSGIDDISTTFGVNNAVMSVSGKTVQFSVPSNVEVYSTDSRRIFSGKTDMLQLNAGLYLMVVDGNRHKIVIR